MTESRNPKYKKGLVIFIDILGSQNQNDFAKLYEINNTFHSMLIDNGKNDNWCHSEMSSFEHQTAGTRRKACKYKSITNQ